ncbi:MAG TPA: glycosyltransferase family 39 protein, partial [Gemmatimonadaceae bacterium]
MAEQPRMTAIEPSTPRGFHESAWPHARNAVFLLIGAGALLRLLLASSIGLGVDESYAVTVARDWSLSYFDHPPLSFWLAGAVARMAGSEYRLFVRLPFILLFAGTSWMMYRLGARLFGERAGFYATLLLNLSPVFSATTGGWVLPDGPLVFFMLATVLCLERVLFHEETVEHPTRWWLAAGVFTGLAMLSKYHGVFLAAGTLLFLLTQADRRRWLLRPEPYLAAAMAAAMFLPVLIWNEANGWVSFRFQGARGVPHHGSLLSFLQTLGGQAGYLLPWIWVPLVWLLAKGLVEGSRNPKRWFLCCLAVGPILFFTLPSLGGKPGLPHWAAPGYLLLFPLLGAAVDRHLAEGSSATRRWLAGSAAGFLIILAVAATHAATGWMARLAPALFERGDPSWEVVDWSELRPVLAELGVAGGAHRIVAAANWIDAGKVAHALGPDVPVVCLCDHPHHFRFLYPATEARGRDVVLVERVRAHSDVAADMARHSRAVEP